MPVPPVPTPALQPSISEYWYTTVRHGGRSGVGSVVTFASNPIGTNWLHNAYYVTGGLQWVGWDGITRPIYPEHIRLPDGA